MKYTKKQRHEIYKKALEIFQDNVSLNTNKYSFVCNCIKSDECSADNFPELFLFRMNASAAWLSDIGYTTDMEPITWHRRTVLMFCIEMTR